MKLLTIAICTVTLFASPFALQARPSVKSHVPGSGGGTYVGSSGSSHKGSHYINHNTANHYRDRAHGVPH
jgi:hypothetical protein